MTMKHRLKKRGFTLIELIVVMAITTILLTIIAVPVIQSFNLTRASQGFANAQAKARELVSQIETEISNSAGVRDNSGYRGAVDVPVPASDGTTEVLVRLPYTKIDILKVASGDPSTRVGTAYIDPDTGKIDPTLKSPKGQPRLQSTPGDTIVRYFVGLRDPRLAYNNPYVQYRTPANTRWLGFDGGQDNLFVLYRAEVRPYIWADPDGAGPQPVQRVVNTAFFIDLDRADANPNTTGPLLDDPSFFVWDDGAPGAIYGTPTVYDPANRNEMVSNWMKAATIVTENSRYDMVMAKYNPQNFAMQFVGTVPELVPLVRFNPTRVAQETATGRSAVRTGEETENAINIGPDVFETQYKNWAGAQFRVWPSSGPDGSGPLANSAGRPVVAAPTSATFLQSVLKADDDQSLFLGVDEVFNISAYLRLKASNAAYPFSNATLPAAVTFPNSRDFMPMVPDNQTGKILASFAIEEFGADAGVALDDRIPSTGADSGVDSGPAVTPATVGYQAGAFNAFTTINERFALQYNIWDSLWPVGTAPSKDGPLGPKRYIDLRATRQFGPSNVESPLSPTWRMNRIQITPGSVEVYGPDQRAGSNYGQLVRYDEVPNTDSTPVGTNQFKVNYTHKANEPDWNGLFGFAAPNYNPDFYNAGDFLSSTIQARYRTGYLELNSRYGEPIPVGNIYVRYRFQFTDSKSVLAVDYDSGELMEVVLTIRNYPQTTNPNPQMVTVRGSAAVRNTLR